ncbi:MAG: hypothetical protein JSV45_14915 [Chromatiales bacterium]|nr:MAG: hypothetical protein JSV45_14915 [Chromatiales bacterium]
MIRAYLPALAALLLLGCSGPADDDQENPVEDTVFDDQVQTMDRARDVEDQLMDSADARRRALEDQER